MRKQYFARIYKPTINGVQGAFIKTVKDFVWPGYSWSINGGLGETVLTFARPFSNFGEGDDIDFFNQVDIYVTDKESPATGALVYSGEIRDYSPILDVAETVEVTVWGYGTGLSKRVLEDSNGNTSISYYSKDPADILADVLSKYNGKVTYNLPPILEEKFDDWAAPKRDSGGYWNGENKYMEIQNGNYSQSNQVGSIDAILDGGAMQLPEVNQVVEFKHDCTITSVEMMIKKFGNPTDNLQVGIYACDQYGIPDDGNLLSNSYTIAASSFGYGYQMLKFTFMFSVSPTQGQSIAFKLKRTGTANPTNAYQVQYNFTNLTDFSVFLYYLAFLSYMDPMAMVYRINYSTTDNTAISKGYDTTLLSPDYLQCTPVTVGNNIIMYYSDSADNASWGAWTTDITILSRRYIRWKAVTTGSLQITDLLFDISGGSLNRSNTKVSYDFKQNTIQECINQVLTMSPAYWWWRIGADNKMIFNARDTNLVDHVLTVGKDILYAKITRSAKDMVNTFYFLGGGDPPLFIKSARNGSVKAYGIQADRAQDERVTNQDSAKIISNTNLDVNDHPAIIGSVIVADSNGDKGGYDIDSFQVGQIVVINDPQNLATDSKWGEFNWGEGYWGFSLTASMGVPFQIMSISYQLEKATLQLAYYAADGAKRIQDIKRNLEQSRTINTPTAPTIV